MPDVRFLKSHRTYKVYHTLLTVTMIVLLKCITLLEKDHFLLI